MTLLNRLERSLGFLSIANLPVFIVTAQSILYIYSLINPEGFHLMVFDPLAIVYGHEYWRVLTSLFVIPVQNAVFAFFFLYMLYYYGTALEEHWGSFQFTMFYLTGVIGVFVSGFVFGSINGAFFLNTTIFLAFAAIDPDFQLQLYFFIPIKVKWLAWLAWAGLIFEFLFSSSYTRAAIACSLINYFLFFGKHHVETVIETVRRVRHRQKYNSWNN